MKLNGKYTFSRPCTKSPDSYLKDDSASHSLEHFLSAGVRKRHSVFTIWRRKDLALKCEIERPLFAYERNLEIFVAITKTVPK